MSTDRWLRAGNCPLLRLQGLAFPRYLPGSLQREAAAAPSGSCYVFFGFETDVALATYLFAVVERAARTETATFRKLNPPLQGVRLRQASANFQNGVVARVSDRLDAMHGAREATVRALRSTGPI